MEPCAICLENTDNSSYNALCCKGKFHFECLHQWFKIKNTCPLCRKEYSHMEHYNSDLEQYAETINNIDMKKVINNISENVNVYKQQFDAMNLDTLKNLMQKTENFLSVLNEFYENKNKS